MPQFEQHAVMWIVSCALVVAAVIDARTLKVPNWFTYSFAAVGLLTSFLPRGLTPGDSALGLALGLLLLLPLYAIGGMGAGDVKLLAGLGAWVGPTLVWQAFVVSVVVGALMALAMMFASGRVTEHFARMKLIAVEWFTVRNPALLAQIAAERKPSMCLLPYGVPIAIGSIGFFAVSGLLI